MLGGDRALHSMMLDRGELDLVYLAQIPDIVRLTRNPRLKDVVHPIDQAGTDFLYLNNELPPFDNLRVRQAMNHAINKQRLVRFTAHTSVPAGGILPPVMLGFNPEQRGLQFDPEVNRLLAEADRIAVPSERYLRYRQIENLILLDAPVVPLLYSALPVLISPRIGGFAPHPVWGMQLEHWWATGDPNK